MCTDEKYCQYQSRAVLLYSMNNVRGIYFSAKSINYRVVSTAISKAQLDAIFTNKQINFFSFLSSNATLVLPLAISLYERLSMLRSLNTFCLGYRSNSFHNRTVHPVYVYTTSTFSDII